MTIMNTTDAAGSVCLLKNKWHSKSANKYAREMECNLFDGAESDDHNSVSFVEISETLLMQDS